MMHEPLILAFDTATRQCSVALTRGQQDEGEVVGAVSFSTGVTHSRRLLAAIDWLLEMTGQSLRDLAAIAVGLGPGSFTGLRIGMATAKGLCHGSALPLIGISSLDAVGCAIRSDTLIGVVFDARKREVYGCFYRSTDGPEPVRCSEPFVIPPQQLAEQIDEPVIMGGDGIVMYRSVFAEALGDRLEIAPAGHRFPSAQTIGFLAADRYQAEQFLDLADATPAYVRNSDAQLSLVSPVRDRVGVSRPEGDSRR